MRRSLTVLFHEVRHIERKHTKLVGKPLSDEDKTTEASRLDEVLHAAELAYQEAVQLTKNSKPNAGCQKFPKISTVLLNNLSADERDIAPQTSCSVCGLKLPSKALRCLFCNYKVCGKCFAEDLLIYMPSDKELHADFWPNTYEKLKNTSPKSKSVRWAVKSSLGYPEWDPEFFEYFPLCSLCQIKLVSIKRDHYSQYQRATFSQNCEKFYISLAKAKLSVKQCMEDLQVVFEKQSSANGSILKLQEEVDLKMATFKKHMAALDTLEPKRNSQITLVKNLKTGSEDWYRLTKQAVDTLLQDIYNSISLKELTDMQLVVEKLAFCSAVTIVKQVFEETMRLCREYELSFSILNGVAAVESCMWSNLNQLDAMDAEEFLFLKKNIESHVSSMMTQEKAIRFTVSQMKFEKEGKSYIMKVIYESSALHLSKVMKEMSSKCRKRVMDESMEAISNLVTTHHAAMFASFPSQRFGFSLELPQNSSKEKTSSLRF